MKTRRRRRARRDKHPWRVLSSCGFSRPPEVKLPDVPMPHNPLGRRWAL